MAREGFVAYHDWLESLTPFGDAECERLFKACLRYSMTGEAPELGGNERFIWPTLAQKIDRDKAAYEARCAANRANRIGGNDVPQTSTIVDDRQEPITESDEEARNAPIEKETKKKLNQKETKTEKEKRESARARGAFGWVKLTDSQYDKLVNDLGEEEALRCIAYIDELAQSSHNKNHWTDWNLVVRRCHRGSWGLEGQKSQGRPNKILTAADYDAKRQGVAPLNMDALDALVDQI